MLVRSAFMVKIVEECLRFDRSTRSSMLNIHNQLTAAAELLDKTPTFQIEPLKLTPPLEKESILKSLVTKYGLLIPALDSQPELIPDKVPLCMVRDLKTIIRELHPQDPQAQIILRDSILSDNQLGFTSLLLRFSELVFSLQNNLLNQVQSRMIPVYLMNMLGLHPIP